MRITLVGWNCKKNVGDDIMTDVIISRLHAKFPKASFKIIGDQNDLPLFQSSLLDQNIKVNAVRNYNFFNSKPIVRTLYNWIFIRALIALRSDFIIIGGGTIFHSAALSRFYKSILKLKNIFNSSCKVYSLGVSVGPFKQKKDEKAFVDVLKQIDHISLRDERSFELVKKLNRSEHISHYPDLALGYPALAEIETKRKNQIAVVLRQGHVAPSIKSFLVSLLKAYNELYKQDEIIFYSFCEYYLPSENDSVAIADLIQSSPVLNKLPIRVVAYANEPHDFCLQLAENRFIISMRLHGNVMAYAMKVPFFMISYHKKCEDFFHELEIDKKYLLDVTQNSDTYIQELANVREDDSVFIFDDQYLKESEKHFSIL